MIYILQHRNIYIFQVTSYLKGDKMKKINIYIGLNKGYNENEQMNEQEINELKDDLIKLFERLTNGKIKAFNFSIVEYKELDYKEKTLIASICYEDLDLETLLTEQNLIKNFKEKWKQEALFYEISEVKGGLI